MKRKILSSVLIVVLLAVLVTVPLFTAACEEEAPAEISIALSGTIVTVDPANGACNMPVTANVFESLVKWDENCEIAPQLATSWTVSDDGLTIDMELREGVEFSSGDPFTAKDIIFSFDQASEKSPPLGSLLNRGLDRVEIIDDYTVKFHFTNFDAKFLPSLFHFYIVSQDYYDRVGEEEYNNNPVGTGPYKISDWQEGQYVNLVANENYWGEQPQIQQAYFAYVAEASTRIAMLQAGEVDMIQDAPWNMVPVLEEDGYSRTDIPLSNSIGLDFHLLNPDAPWAELEVRQAINYAIDKDALIEQLFSGIPEKVGWQLEWEPGYDATLEPVYPYDIEQAQALMEEAGYADGFTMPLYYNASFSWGRDLVEYVANTLTQLNITCEVTAITTTPDLHALLRELHTDTTAEAVILGGFSYPGGATPLTGLSNAFSLNGSVSLYGREDLEDIITQIGLTVDDTERAALIQEAFQIIDADLPDVIFFLNTICYIYNSNIEYNPTFGAPISGIEYNPAVLKDLVIN